MRWCLHLKLSQNPVSFGRLLDSTGDRPIVEDSRKDAFWGAIPDATDTTLTGCNVLGQLLMELRDQRRAGTFVVVQPDLPNFKLFNEPVVVVFPHPAEAPLTDLFL
jgi:type I restriction enzyme S subunit